MCMISLDPNKAYSVAEVAALADCDTALIYKKIKDGTLERCLMKNPKTGRIIRGISGKFLNEHFYHCLDFIARWKNNVDNGEVDELYKKRVEFATFLESRIVRRTPLELKQELVNDMNKQVLTLSMCA